MAGKHIQTIVEEGQFVKLKMLALTLGIPLRDLLRQIVNEYIESQKENHNE